MPWKAITRQELYEETWSQALCKLAPKHNPSDFGFAKLCKRCDIPRPPRGYWAKLKAGKKVKRTPLSSLEDELEIGFYVAEPGEAIGSGQTSQADLDRATMGLLVIQIADSLRGSHQFVFRVPD